MADFDINTLCEKARVTPRTVHFYVQQGLLPPAGSPGPGARYTDGHVARIRLIRLLQKQHLPLAEIAKRTKGLSDDQIEDLIAETKQRRAEPKGSALEYIRGILAEPRPSPADVARVSTRVSMPAAVIKESLLSRTPATAPAAPTRSQWERFTFTDGIELHVRRPLSREEQRQLEKLMLAARAIFEDSEEEA